jgi:DNA-directed RNA polymerase beta' subunit
MLNPVTLATAVKELCNDLGYVFLNEIQKKLKRRVPHYIVKSTIIMQILIRSYLCMSYLTKKKVGDAMLGIIIEKIVLIYKKSLMDYGSTCGVLAAQCLSEPLVQFVLNSKHRSGGLGGTQTNEIVRIQEILGAKDTDIMKNPRMLIMVKPEFEYDKLKVQEIANHIEMMKFGMFIVDTRIFFEEYGKPTHEQFKHEAAVIASIEKHHFGQKVPNDLSKWCIRFTMDKEGLIIKSMKLETLILALRREHPEIFIVHTPETADVVFVRCYLRNTYFKQTSNYFEDNVIPLMKKIKDVIVRGVKDIISVGVIDVVKTVKQENGSLDMKKAYGIYTVGTNLSEILANPYIDPYRTQSDSIEEIERIFGVVAARHKIMNELVNVLKSISRMHCGIFADEMTYSGAVTSIQKTGLQKREMANITLRLSFQTPIQVIQEAAINGLTDHISGVSGPLIMGTNPNIGTTYNTIVINENFIKANVKTLSNVIDEL